MERALDHLLRHRWAALTLLAAVTVAGVVAWRALPIDAFPDVTNVQVMVLSRAPALSAEEVEQRVTFPVEQEMGGLPRVTQVRSLSRGGLSQVVVVFEDGVDPYFARQVVFERLQGATDALPPGVEAELAPLSTGLGEIFQYTLEGEGYSLEERRTIQDWLVRPRLRTVPGVTEVNSLGGEVRQYQVTVLPERLLQYGLTLRDVVDAVAGANANAGAGYIVKGWEQMYIRSVGAFADVEDIRRVVLRAAGGRTVLLGDVATVAIGPAPRQGAVTRDGRGETVAGMTIMLHGSNSRSVVAAVRQAVERLQASLPAGLRLDVFYDRTELIRACIATVSDALLLGGVLVVVVLALFLAEIRTALVVLVSLPVSYLLAFVAMRLLGMSSNLMSLGGLAFSVGMVVDASIVIAENVRRHLAEAGPAADRRRVVVRAIAEVARPVALSVLIIVLVLVPLFTLQGLEGKMFGPLALALLLSLLASIVVALVFVPALSDLALSNRPERELAVVSALHRAYQRSLEAALARPRLTFAVTLVALVSATALVPAMGTDFLPALDEGSIAVNVVRLPNASLDGSVAVATMLEKRILALPEVATVVSKTGRAEISEDPMGPEQTDLYVMLRPRRAWRNGVSKADLVDAIDREIRSVPGLRPSFSQPIALRVNELISGVKSDLAVKVFGADLDEVKDFADRAAAVISGVEGARDVKVEQVAGMNEVQVVLDRRALASWGLSVGSVNGLLEAAFAGATVTQVLEGDRRVDVTVRLTESARGDLEALEALLVPTPEGARVPLVQLASIGVVEGPAQISRENGQRRVVVETNVRGRDLGGFVAEVQERLAPLVESLPTGAFVEYGGQFENQRRAMRQLALVVPAAVAVVLVLLYLALGSARDSLLVLLNLPFALVGGVVAAVACGMTMTVSAAVAFIVLLGIAVQNGVVLVAFLGQLRDRVPDPRERVVEACRRRWRPLLMTAFTSFIGHLPMALSGGAGADIQKPLAVIVMGGIITSTLLTQLVLPVLYHWLEARRG